VALLHIEAKAHATRVSDELRDERQNITASFSSFSELPRAVIQAEHGTKRGGCVERRAPVAFRSADSDKRAWIWREKDFAKHDTRIERRPRLSSPQTKMSNGSR
jgi:hypothetical protein